MPVSAGRLVLLALIAIALLVCAILSTSAAAQDEAGSVSAHGRLR